MSVDYEKLLIENRKSFREALRRQRKANELLHQEIAELKSRLTSDSSPKASQEHLSIGEDILELLKEIHRKSVYQLHPKDDRPFHLPYDLWTRIENALDLITKNKA